MQRIEAIMKMLTVIATLLLMVLTVQTVDAKTWHIEMDGSGDYTVIQAALNVCAPGDTVLIGPGRYTEHAPFDFGALTEDTYVVVDTPNITLRGVDRDTVIIGPEVYDAPNSREPNGIATTTRGEGVSVENLTVENVAEGLAFLVGATVKHCLLQNCNTGAAIIAPRPQLVIDTEFVNCERYSAGCWVDGASIQVLGCRFEAYVEFPGAQSPGGLLISGARDAMVEDSVFAGDAYLQFQMFCKGSVRNCVFDAGPINILSSSAHIEGNVMNRSPLSNLVVSAADTVTANRNVFGGGEDVTLFLSAQYVKLNENHIFNASDVLNPKRLTVAINNYDSADHTLDLTNNWWGTTRATAIAEWIRDVNDDPYFNIAVEFEPFALEPLPAATSTAGGLKAGFGRP